MNKKFLRPEWQQLLEEERKDLLKQIGERYGMKLKKYAHFSRYGQELDTAVYLYQDSEFVFVPGDTVTLGYDYTAVKFDVQSKAALYEEVDCMEGLIDEEFFGDESEYEEEQLERYIQKAEAFGIGEQLRDNYLKVSFTPVRQAEIGPMLVERKVSDPFWKPVSLEDPLITEKFAKELEEFKKGDSRMHTYVGNIRFLHENDKIRAERCDLIGRTELIKQLEDMRFSLPTEDEWEYLCGGGCRTLFPWGESFYNELLADKPQIKDLKKPNFFGLSIAYDSYQQEVLLDKGLKGGDGGVSCCGGWAAFSCLTASPYFTPEFMMEEGEEDSLMEDFNFIRRVIRVTDYEE
ncbi:MAG: formylglycine-generating enzyme family protein [Lachnospiraceae bacterium]|nr:formylglycine-generating enzyme family protein [Lachnospiraceae bacterium]